MSLPQQTFDPALLTAEQFLLQQIQQETFQGPILLVSQV
jgi:hypothetical protein